MASINMDSILSKANTFLGSSSGMKKRNVCAQEILSGKKNSGNFKHTPEEAASKFIEVLKNSIDTSGLSPNAISAISNIDYGDVTIHGTTGTVKIQFVGDMSRPSLAPNVFDGIDDIVALFNNGVDHKMRGVHGTWHGKETWSRTVIPGTHFIEQAVSTFMGLYAAEYGVISIDVNGLD